MNRVMMGWIALMLSLSARGSDLAAEPLSLNFQDVEVRAVLQVLADYAGVNLVASDAVQGNLSLRLHEVPWDQALALVLDAKGLSGRREGNVLIVAPAASSGAPNPAGKVDERGRSQLIRELLPIHHADAGELAKVLLASQLRSEEDAEAGSLSVDTRTNTLLAIHTPARLAELRNLVKQLDVPVRQVMIEARIVEANVNYEKALGGRWGARVGKAPALNSELFVDLGVEAATSRLGVGLVRGDVLLDLELSAMEKSGNGEIISQPKVVTADKETARILKGTEVPYQETTKSGATSVRFREASLSLEVTPQITPDGKVIMAVRVTKDEPDYVNALNDVPPIRKNEVNANVRVADGETVVIGGVYSTAQNNVVDKVPLLGDLPYVGRLFRRNAIQERKSELLVFLTPRIMNDQPIAVSR